MAGGLVCQMVVPIEYAPAQVLFPFGHQNLDIASELGGKGFSVEINVVGPVVNRSFERKVQSGNVQGSVETHCMFPVKVIVPTEMVGMVGFQKIVGTIIEKVAASFQTDRVMLEVDSGVQMAGKLGVAHVWSKQAYSASGLIGEHFPLLAGEFGTSPYQVFLVKLDAAEGIAAVAQGSGGAQAGVSFVFMGHKGSQSHLSPVVKTFPQGQSQRVANSKQGSSVGGVTGIDVGG